MKKSKLLSVIYAFAAAFFVISASIAVPILCRPFYYAHIKPYDLAEGWGLTEKEVRDAFNEMLDYCIGKSDEFGTGILVWSQDGKDHFTDCRALFLLDFAVCAACTALLILVLALRLGGMAKPARPGGRSPLFWSGIGIGGLFLFLGGTLVVAPDWAFLKFHEIFFPGKTNWTFDPMKDSIILILPEEYFIHCGILIAGLILISAVLMVVLGGKKKAKKANA